MMPGWQEGRHAAVEFEGYDLLIFLVVVSGEAGYLIENGIVEAIGLCP